MCPHDQARCKTPQAVSTYTSTALTAKYVVYVYTCAHRNKNTPSKGCSRVRDTALLYSRFSADALVCRGTKHTRSAGKEHRRNDARRHCAGNLEQCNWMVTNTVLQSSFYSSFVVDDDDDDGDEMRIKLLVQDNFLWQTGITTTKCKCTHTLSRDTAPPNEAIALLRRGAPPPVPACSAVRNQ